MSKYPFVYLMRDEKYSYIDKKFADNEKQLECTVEIISPGDKHKINNMFDPNYQVLVTYGNNASEYHSIIDNDLVPRLRNRWMHKKEIKDLGSFNKDVNCCYIYNALMKREETRPVFSIFTTCYNSFDKIKRAYEGLKLQVMRDWEWVILDDSPDDSHFNFLKTIAVNDKRIRLYNRNGNSGSIGNVKNEAVALCRGKYVLELDHDDIIVPDLLKDATKVFESDKQIGFVFSDFANVYEDWRNFCYGDHLGKGNVCYYKQKYEGKWLDVCACPGINNITSSHLVCLPNHPRMWRRKVLMELENYSEFLPVCDDFEILLRTVCNTKVAKIHKLGYIQFMNDNNNNFSLIRNNEINRLGPYWIRPMFYELYKVNDIMKSKNAYEDEKYIEKDMSQIWKRKNYEHKVCSTVVNPDYDKQYALYGLEALNNKRIGNLYKNPRNDFMLLSNKHTSDELIAKLEEKGYGRMKCYGFSSKTTDLEMDRYFKLICKYTDNYEIFYGNSSTLEIEEVDEINDDNTINLDIGQTYVKNNYKSVDVGSGVTFDLGINSQVDNTPNTDSFSTRHSVINNSIDNYTSYLEIGVEHGFTFQNVNIRDKTGVDPDPVCNDIRIIKKTSDEFFVDNNDNYDVIFIDGMHQADYVLRDFNNSIDCLNKNGLIFLDDVLPLNEREQHKIPIKHVYENGILKYRESWTGDVWKFVYYLIRNHQSQINFDLFTHENYRGILRIKINSNFKISPTKIDDIEMYDYNSDFQNYKNLLMGRKEISTKLSSLDLNTLNNDFIKAKPFSYVTIDNFIDNNVLNGVENELRSMPEDYFRHAIIYGMESVQVNKYACEMRNVKKDSLTYNLIDYLNSKQVLKWLEDITGINGLQADEFTMGGGIHKIKNGGYLNIHADFNRHRLTKKYRRLNLLLYLNSEYKEEYNGHLELWNKDMTSCEKKIAPIFNRAVIMRTTDDGYHGHLSPWLGPDGKERLSIAMYYYTDDRPQHEKSEAAHAQWQTPNIKSID